MTRSALLTLLDAGARLDAEYRGDLSNHLPMALVELTRLGADDARLKVFASHYASRLAPAPTAAVWPAGDPWAGRLGQPAAWPAYRALFAEWLHWEGADVVLPQVLPRLMQGCGAAAFHGLLRTAYAVQAGHEGELADGLAYWACRYLPLGEAVAGDDARADVPAALAALPRRQATARLIADRMGEAAIQPEFDAAVASLAIDARTLGELARHAATLYAASGNFTVLHLVTSCHALRVLLPRLDDAGAALGHYWRAYGAGHVASRLKLDAPADLLPWDRVIAAALASDDEHLIKLVDSCREEEAAYGGDAWQRAASRAVAAGSA
jgi:hypothetical protein